MAFDFQDNSDVAQMYAAIEGLRVFFETLYQKAEDSSKKKNGRIIDSSGIIYREEQDNFAQDVMEAIRSCEILLIQAGVGTGKSFGYLIPIFYTINEVVKFNKVVISTSSIALQGQLLGDIKKVSEMLGIEIKASIAKGINNYACLKKIEEEMHRYGVDPQRKELFQSLTDEIKRVKSSDKSDLQQISRDVWEMIRLKNRGACSGCLYSRMCPYYQQQDAIKDSNIIVTNHAYLAQDMLTQRTLFDANMFVYDEAHKLLESIQGVRIDEFEFERIRREIETISHMLVYRYKFGGTETFITDDDNYAYRIRDNSVLLTAFNNLFSEIMASAKKKFKRTTKKNDCKNEYSITDVNRVGFDNNSGVNWWLGVVLKELDGLFAEIDDYESRNNIRINTFAKKYLERVRDILQDMQRNEWSDYIYWAHFVTEKKIKIMRIPKDSLDVIKTLLSSKVPHVFTSGTIATEEHGYGRFLESLGLNEMVGSRVRTGDVLLSPYDYKNNSLLYYNPKVANPNAGDKYINDLVGEISELIKITNGKALILFTSKVTMNRVYELLQRSGEFPFELLLQTDDNAEEIKEKFSRDTDSCLFATGAFWEGIDIKGRTLSNLIITRLPFDQVDAVTQYGLSRYSQPEQFNAVIFPNMLIKFQQAVGRLIRSDNDTGIVCCLDSRFADLAYRIVPNIPIQTLTTNKRELYEFVDSKILLPNEQKNVVK